MMIRIFDGRRAGAIWAILAIALFARGVSAGDLLVDGNTVLFFSNLDGGEDDEDGASDGILTLSSLTLAGGGEIVIDVPAANFNVAGPVHLEGSASIHGMLDPLPATGPSISIVSGESILLDGTPTIAAEGTNGGSILLCASQNIEISGNAATIACDGGTGIGGLVILRAGEKIKLNSGASRVRANGAIGGSVTLLSCGEDSAEEGEEAGQAILVKGKIEAIGEEGVGGTVDVTARRGGIKLQQGSKKILAEGSAGNGTIILTAGTSITPDPPPTKPDATLVTGALTMESCACGVLVTIDSPENLTLTNATAVDVSGTAVSSFDIVSVSVNGVPAIVTGETFSAPGVALTEGTNTLSALVLDAAGLVGTANVQVVRDTTPPTVVITSPQNDTKVFSPEISVSGIVNDTIVGVVNASPPVVEVAGTPVAVMNNAFVAPSVALVPGINVIPVTATDQVGNVGNTSVQVKFDDEAISKIEVFDGNNQSAPIGQPLPQALVARLLDEAGAPVPNQPVIFKVTQNNGTFDDGTRLMLVNTDGQGLAPAELFVGSRSGEGCNRVEAASVGFAGKAIFLATSVGGPAGKINVSMGTPQKGLVNSGLPEPLGALVTDDAGNPVSDLPVTYQVVAGGGHFVESDSDTLVINTDVAGRVAATMILGPAEGSENNIVEASVQGLGALPAIFVASGVAPGDPADTTFSGVVLDNSDLPVPDVVISVENTELLAVSDIEGQFFLADIPVGPIRLIADGSTTTRPGNWPTLAFDVVTIAGIDNTLGMPIYLLPLVDGVPLAGGDEEVVLTLDEVPGFELRVLANSTSFPCGQGACSSADECDEGSCPIGHVTVTQVHADKIPMSPMDGLQPTFIITIQPAGVHFDPPAVVCYPNSDGLTPGEMTNLYSFDHDLDRFVMIGPGTVSEDGSVVCSDPGFGIIKGGWHCAGPSQPTGGAAPANARITNPTPKNFTIQLDPEADGETVSFTAVGTPQPGSMTWSGGEDPATGSGLSFTTTFRTEGVFNVTAKWTCDSGAMGTDTASVVVGDIEVVSIDGPFCTNSGEQLSKSDFTVVTDPEGFEDQAQIAPLVFNLGSATGQSTETVIATLGDSMAQTTIEVVNPDGGVMGDVSLDVGAIIQAINAVVDATSDVVGCDFGGFGFGGSIGVKEGDKCCPDINEILPAETVSGKVDVNLAGVECPLPGLGFSRHGVEVGVFVSLEAKGGIEGTGGVNPCTDQVEGKISVSVGAKAAVTVKAIIFDEDFIAVVGDASTSASVTGECAFPSGQGQVKAVWKPLTLSGKLTVAGFFDFSFSKDVFDSFMTPPFQFGCPNPFS